MMYSSSSFFTVRALILSYLMTSLTKCCATSLVFTRRLLILAIGTVEMTQIIAEEVCTHYKLVFLLVYTSLLY